MAHDGRTRPFDALIFDMDGTLVDNMGCHAECWVALANDHGIPMTLEDYWRREPGGTAAEVVRDFFGDDLPEDRVGCLVEQKEFLYRYLFRKRVRPIPGARRLLAQAWRAKLPVAVASSANRKNIDFTLPALGFSDLIDVIVGAEDVRRGKPAPDLFLLAAERMKVAPSRCLVFEDSSAGLEAARRAGMAAVAIATTHSVGELRKQAGVIAAFPDFRHLTLRILAGLFTPAVKDESASVS